MATTWTNESIIGAQVQALLNIGDGFNLLIDSSYKLEIQSASGGTVWSNDSIDSTTFTNNSII